VLAFPLYATVAWLLWVLSQQLAPQSLLYGLLSLVLIALGLWIWQTTRQAGLAWQRTGWVTSLLIIGLLVTLVYRLEPIAAESGGTQAHWEPYDAAALSRYREAGLPVLVNFTAAWCITCLVNEKVVLSSDAVQAELRARSIVYMKGDWTNRDPVITRVLEQHGRSGVPLYLFYPAGGQPDVIVLPNILTQGILLQTLNQSH
jgi:thiol:disulfide interchange protein DsbD